MQKILLIVSFTVFFGAANANACGGHHTKACSKAQCAAGCMKASQCTNPACMKNGKCTKNMSAKASKHAACAHHCTGSSMKS